MLVDRFFLNHDQHNNQKELFAAIKQSRYEAQILLQNTF